MLARIVLEVRVGDFFFIGHPIPLCAVCDSFITSEPSTLGRGLASNFFST